MDTVPVSYCNSLEVLLGEMGTEKARKEGKQIVKAEAFFFFFFLILSCVHGKYLLNEQMNILNHLYHLSNLSST